MKEGNINSISAMCALLIVFQRRGVEFENVQNLLRTDKDATQAILGGLRKRATSRARGHGLERFGSVDTT